MLFTILPKAISCCTRIIESSGNIFLDLGLDPAEAVVMKLRAEVMIRTAQRLKEQGWTQAEAARQLVGHAASQVTLRATVPVQIKARYAGNGRSLAKERNAELRRQSGSHFSV